MPPRRIQKPAKAKKEDLERRKLLLLAREKTKEIRRMLLSTVEAMTEKDISKDWFLDNCTKLCHADYDDVVQERSIYHLCGYPLCSNVIKQVLKQRYQISVLTNKVYDVTERKHFCSNECYKASKYLKAQLSPEPLYMRKEEKFKVHLLSDCNNRGSAGEEVVFSHVITQNEIEKVYDEVETSTNLHNILNEEVKKCSNALSDLKIKEHVFEKQFVFGDETPKKSDNTLHQDNSESNSDSEDSDDSEDERFFPSYDNLSVLSNKHMPIPKKVVKAVLISPIKPKTIQSMPKQELSLDFVFKVFRDWMTEDTMKFLLGEKYVYDVKAEHLFEKVTTGDPSDSKKLSLMKDEYIKLCLKIDTLPSDDDDDDDDDDNDVLNYSSEFGGLCKSKTSPVSGKLCEKVSTDKNGFKQRPKNKSNAKKKSVTFDLEVKSPDQDAEPKHKDTKSIPVLDEESSEDSPVIRSLPLVDSHSQNALRRQVLTGQFKSMYSELLPIIGLHYTKIQGTIRKFVGTLSLNPKNIIFKPKEWKLISLVLYRMLTKTVIQDHYNESEFLKLCEDPFIPVSIDTVMLEKIVSDLLSPENIVKVK